MNYALKKKILPLSIHSVAVLMKKFGLSHKVYGLFFFSTEIRFGLASGTESVGMVLNAEIIQAML